MPRSVRKRQNKRLSKKRQFKKRRTRTKRTQRKKRTMRGGVFRLAALGARSLMRPPSGQSPGQSPEQLSRKLPMAPLSRMLPEQLSRKLPFTGRLPLASFTGQSSGNAEQGQRGFIFKHPSNQTLLGSRSYEGVRSISRKFDILQIINEIKKLTENPDALRKITTKQVKNLIDLLNKNGYTIDIIDRLPLPPEQKGPLKQVFQRILKNKNKVSSLIGEGTEYIASGKQPTIRQGVSMGIRAARVVGGPGQVMKMARQFDRGPLGKQLGNPFGV